MGTKLTALALLAFTTPCWSQDGWAGFDAGADLRAMTSNGERSYLNGGLGDLQYDSQHAGARLGSLWIDYHGSALDVMHFVVDAVGYGDGNRLPLDVTQAFAEWRPFPMGPWRSRVKIGAFLCADFTGKLGGRMAQSVHAVLLGDQYLGWRRTAHYRR